MINQIVDFFLLRTLALSQVLAPNKFHVLFQYLKYRGVLLLKVFKKSFFSSIL